MTASNRSSDISRGEDPGAIGRGPAGAILRASDVSPWFEGDNYRAAAAKALQEASQKATELAEIERKRGFDEGWEAGSKEIFEFLAQTKSAADNYFAQLESTLTELTIRLMREILDDLDASEVVSSAVRRALRAPNIGDEVILHVAPEILSQVRDNLSESLNYATTSVISLMEDPTLPPTGCRLVSEYCTIDISVERQLDLLAESLRASNIGIRR